MTKIEKAMAFVDKMIEDFGVHSYLLNLTKDNTVEDEGIWFECPICGEPILIGEDWDLDEVTDHCPICEADYWEDC